MIQTQAKILNVLTQAIGAFNAYEKYLVTNNLSERCICSKFAAYLERAINMSELYDYTVDVEYNCGYDGKTYGAKKLFDGRIFVDIIVHKRGDDDIYGFDNLFCIEMKKSTNKRGLVGDERRLRALTDGTYGFNYQAGFLILIVMDHKNEDEGLKIEKTFWNRAFFPTD